MFIYILFVVQQLIASSSHIFAKDAAMIMHPVNVVFYRGAFATLLYSLPLLFRRHEAQPVTNSDKWRYLLLGLMNIPMSQMFFVWGLRYTTPANAALAYALSPAFVAIIGSVFYREKLSAQVVTGIGIAIIGTFIVLFEKGLDTSPEYLMGNVIELCASLSWSFYTVLGRSLSLRYGAIRTTGLSMLTGFAIFALFMAIFPLDFEFAAPPSLTLRQWTDLLYLGLITSGVGFGLWQYLLTKRSSVQVSVFNNLQPVITTILTVLIFGLRPSLAFILGGVITLSGVLITQRK